MSTSPERAACANPSEGMAKFPGFCNPRLSSEISDVAVLSDDLTVPISRVDDLTNAIRHHD